MDGAQTGVWVAKDPYGQQGKQVLLFHDIAGVKRKIAELKAARSSSPESKQYQLIQKYIESPMLVHGKKFGFRAFALIASLDPFVLLFQRGFISRCGCDFDLNFTQFSQEDKCKHITQRRWQKVPADAAAHNASPPSEPL